MRLLQQAESKQKFTGMVLATPTAHQDFQKHSQLSLQDGKLGVIPLKVAVLSHCATGEWRQYHAAAGSIHSCASPTGRLQSFCTTHAAHT